MAKIILEIEKCWDGVLIVLQGLEGVAMLMIRDAKKLIVI